MSGKFDRGKAEGIAVIVVDELERASDKFGAFSGPHDGYAVILEELNEAWDEIKKNNSSEAWREMVQVAAMAMRFIYDLAPEDALAVHELHQANEFAKKHPLPRCKHGTALKDHGGNDLYPPCGCARICKASTK